MRLSYLQNHYDLEEVEGGYRFLTDNNVEYYLTFIEYPVVGEFLATKIYMFNIDRTSPKVGQKDVRLVNTILYVLHHFFEKNDDAIITISDISDDRQAARKRLFDSWFNTYNDGRLEKLDGKFVIEDSPVFVSLLYSAENFNHRNLVKAFQTLIDNNFYC